MLEGSRGLESHPKRVQKQLPTQASLQGRPEAQALGHPNGARNRFQHEAILERIWKWFKGAPRIVRPSSGPVIMAGFAAGGNQSVRTETHGH